MNRLNNNLRVKIICKYRSKLKDDIVNIGLIGSRKDNLYYYLEILEANILYFKNNYKSILNEENNELSKYILKIFNVKSVYEYKKEE